jgi:AraC-like DNA-binding protein
MLEVHSPSPPLARYVETLWYEDGDQAVRHTQRVLPGGGFMLVIELTGGPGVVIGMRSRYIEINPAAIHTVMGVVFRPGGARPFFDVPADEFSGHVVPLDLVWSCAVHGLRDRLWEAPTVAEKFRLLECELQHRVQPRVGLHPAVRYGLTEFHRGPHLRGVIEVTRDAGLSRRRFAQLFREQVGMTPKRYCRLHRFHNVTRQICEGKAVDWADLALAGGYSDQAHLSHEFREFSGLSPTAFLAERRSCDHTRVD